MRQKTPESSSKRIFVLRPAVSNEVRLAAYVALANIGIEREKNVAAVEKHLNGAGKNPDALLQAMLFTGSQSWVTDSMVSRLAELIGVEDDGALFAAVFAASLGNRGSPALPAIRAAAEHARANHPDGGFVIYELAMAKLESGRRNAIADTLVAILGGDNVGFGHTMWAAYFLVASFLLNDEDVSVVVGLLDHSNPNVVEGAARLCSAIGIRARAAERRLVRVVETAESERLRDAAAGALGMVGSEQCIPQLQALARRENSESVKSTIKGSIDLIRLESRAVE